MEHLKRELWEKESDEMKKILADFERKLRAREERIERLEVLGEARIITKNAKIEKLDRKIKVRDTKIEALKQEIKRLRHDSMKLNGKPKIKEVKYSNVELQGNYICPLCEMRFNKKSRKGYFFNGVLGLELQFCSESCKFKWIFNEAKQREIKEQINELECEKNVSN